MCCGNKALTVFAYHVLTDVSEARDVNSICCSQMRLLPLLLMERIRNWLHLFLHSPHDMGSMGFHVPLSLSLLIISLSLSCILFFINKITYLRASSFSPPSSFLIFLTPFTYKATRPSIKGHLLLLHLCLSLSSIIW